MPTTRQGTSNNMTPEAVRAMIDQAMQRNSTNDDRSNSSRGGPTIPWNGHLRTLGHDDAYAMTCYECGNQGHYKSDCLELKNRNHGDQAEGIGARGMVYAFGGGETNQDHDDIEDDIND
nr:hypothetical protein [Tanacetum cinerariifolium]